MNWILGLGASLIGALVFAHAVGHLIVVARLVRLQFWTVGGKTVARDQAGDERIVLDAAVDTLEQAGFVYQRTERVGSVIASLTQQASHCDFYHHPTLDVHAEVIVSGGPTPRKPFDIVLLNFYRDGSIVMTVNAAAFELFIFPPDIIVADACTQTFPEQMEAHLARRDAITLERTDPAEAPMAAGAMAERIWPSMVEQRRAYVLGERDGRPVYALRLLTAIKGAWRLRLSSGLHGILNDDEVSKEAPAQSAPPAFLAAERIAFVRGLCTLNAMRAPRWFRWSAFVVSAGAFIGLGTWWWGITFALLVAAVVAVHEAGHWLAMRLAKFRDIQVFFVPGFGGATSGEKHEASPVTLLAVFLAGPLPGVLLSLGLIGWMLFGGADQGSWWYAQLAMLAVITFLINFINLLPVTPLDGGRVIELLVMARLPWLRFIFTLASATFLGWSGLNTGDRVLQGFAILLLLAIPHHFRTAKLSRGLLRSTRKAPMADEDFAGAADRLYEVLAEPAYCKWDFKAKTTVGWAILPRFLGRLPSARETALGLTIYLTCLVGPLAVLAVFAFKEPDRLAYIALESWRASAHRNTHVQSGPQQSPSAAETTMAKANDTVLRRAKDSAGRIVVLDQLIEQAYEFDNNYEVLRLDRLLYTETAKLDAPSRKHAETSLELALALK